MTKTEQDMVSDKTRTTAQKRKGVGFIHVMLLFFLIFGILAICLGIKNKRKNTYDSEKVKFVVDKPLLCSAFAIEFNKKMTEDIEKKAKSFKIPQVPNTEYNRSHVDKNLLKLKYFENISSISRKHVSMGGNCGYHSILSQYLEILRGTNEHRRKNLKTDQYKKFFDRKLMLRSYSPIIVDHWMPIVKKAVNKIDKKYLDLNPTDIYNLVLWLRLIICAHFSKAVEEDLPFTGFFTSQARKNLFATALSLNKWIDSLEIYGFGRFFNIEIIVLQNINGNLKLLLEASEENDLPKIIMIYSNRNHYDPAEIL